MSKTFKSFFYIIACAIVFLGLVKSYGGSLDSQSAIVFDWEKTVDVYFVDQKMAEIESCKAVTPLQRIVLNAETLGPGALEALIKGLTGEEEASGQYISSINPKTLIQKFEIKDRIAFVDFSSALNEKAKGSCLITSIRSQIENTLNALPDIDSTIISVNGQTDGILEP